MFKNKLNPEYMTILNKAISMLYKPYLETLRAK